MSLVTDTATDTDTATVTEIATEIVTDIVPCHLSDVPGGGSNGFQQRAGRGHGGAESLRCGLQRGRGQVQRADQTRRLRILGRDEL